MSTIKPTTLRSGESAQPATPTVMKTQATRSYFHMVKGAKFVMPDGLEVQFLGGVFTTADPDIMRELDAVANKPASMIYTKAEVVEAVKALTAAAAADAVQKLVKE